MGAAFECMVFRNVSPTYQDCTVRYIRRTDGIEYDIPYKIVVPSGISIGSWNVTRTIFVYSHGNCEDIGHVERKLEPLASKTQSSFIAYDYSGYGTNRGQRGINEAVEDLRQVVEWVSARAPASRIVMVGKSVGSGPTCALAAEFSETGRDIGGIAILGGFTSCAAVLPEVGQTIAWAFPWADPYNNIRLAPRITCPTAIVHGLSDVVVPPSHSRLLYAAFSASPWLRIYNPLGVGHRDLEMSEACGRALNDIADVVSSKYTVAAYNIDRPKEMRFGEK